MCVFFHLHLLSEGICASSCVGGYLSKNKKKMKKETVAKNLSNRLLAYQ